MTPPPPVRFSTTTGWPSTFDRSCATARAAKSVVVLGGKATSSVIGLVGQDCAVATCVASVTMAATASRRRMMFSICRIGTVTSIELRAMDLACLLYGSPRSPELPAIHREDLRPVVLGGLVVVDVAIRQRI